MRLLKLCYFNPPFRFRGARKLGKFFRYKCMKMLGFLGWKRWRFYFTTSTYRSSISLFILCYSWDEWVGLDRLLKFTEENVQKQQELNEKRGTDKKASRASHIKPKNGNCWFV